MADRFPIILNTSANQLQELASGDTLDVSGAAIKSNLVDSLSVVGTGVSIVGVVTATSFVGSGAALTGIDITALKDSGGNVKVQAEASGAVYTGIHTFGSTTSFTSGVFNGTVTSTGAVVNGDIDLNGDIDVDGHTNLDNVSIAGVTTTTENINIDADNKRLQIGDGQDLKLYHDGNHSYIDNDTGHLTVTASQINLNNQDNSENCATFAGDGAVNLFYNGNAKLQTATSGVNVSGTTTTTGLSVTGVSTFTGNIDANGDLDVDGHTNLDNVNVAGVTTFAGAINGSSATFSGAINGSSAAFTGNVSVGGVLTYEDVKNVDSVGVATARTGLKVLAGGANIVGVVTASNGIFVPDSQKIHIGNASGSGDLQIYHDTSHSYIDHSSGTGNLVAKTDNDSAFVTNSAYFIAKKHDNSDSMIYAQAGDAVDLYFNGNKKFETTNTGVSINGNATATTFVGALTGTASGNTTISNNADNRVVTGGSGNALNGEANLTYNGNHLTFNTTANSHGVQLVSTGNYYNTLSMDSGATSANAFLNVIDFKWDGDKVADIVAVSGSDTSNKDDGHLVFRTSPAQGSIAERLRIHSDGTVHFYGNQTTTPEGDFGFRWDRNQPVNFQITNTNNTSVNAGAKITLKSNAGNIAGSYYNNGGFYLINSANGYLNYYSNSTLRVNINTNGDVFFNPDDANGIPSSNGSLGKRFGIKSTANNVIIGETTQSSSGHGLHIESRQTGRSGNARIAQIGLKNDASGNGQISFFTAASGADVTERMVIDSNGYVTKPFHPSFQATFGQSSYQIASNSGADIIFTSEEWDVGTNYNTSNGRFTAPIAGKYFFGIQLYLGFSVTAVRVMHSYFSKNGSVNQKVDLCGGINSDAGTHYHPTAVGACMMNLSANDYVTFNIGSPSFSGSGNTYLYPESRFFGYLIG